MKQGHLVANWKRRYLRMRLDRIDYYKDTAQRIPQGTMLLDETVGTKTYYGEADRDDVWYLEIITRTRKKTAKNFLLRSHKLVIEDWQRIIEKRVTAFKSGHTFLVPDTPIVIEEVGEYFNPAHHVCITPGLVAVGLFWPGSSHDTLLLPHPLFWPKMTGTCRKAETTGGSSVAQSHGEEIGGIVMPAIEPDVPLQVQVYDDSEAAAVELERIRARSEEMHALEQVFYQKHCFVYLVVAGNNRFSFFFLKDLVGLHGMFSDMQQAVVVSLSATCP
jgi:hypothetical protein